MSTDETMAEHRRANGVLCVLACLAVTCFASVAGAEVPTSPEQNSNETSVTESAQQGPDEQGKVVQKKDESSEEHPIELGREDDLLDMSLEELMATPIEEAMNVEVALTSRKEERLFDTPAAVYVVTAEDIRRTGATSVPEALRMVPGVQVSRINSNAWAITARGFQDQWGNKLLVLVDGRSVYSTEYSGIYWDVQDPMVEDIERIEVIRGPGGTMWGANAVNGIINIVTKNSKDTQGFLISGGGGNEEQGMGAVRYGGKLGEKAHYRIYARYANYGETIGTFTTNNLGDSWDLVKGGFRFDWDKSDSDKLTLQGDMYYGDVGMTGTRPTAFGSTDILDPVTEVAGGNILGRWTHTFSETSDMSVQMYYDHYKRIESTVSKVDDTVDVDFQHRFMLNEQHEITWGLDYRFNNNLYKSQRTLTHVPERIQTHTYSGFLQDKITLSPEKLWLTVGTKVEHNDYTGFELQPTSRLLWTPDEKNTFWGGVTRAVRTPSRREIDSLIDTGITYWGPWGFRTLMVGNEDFKSEDVISYELGYRVQLGKNLLLDVAGFFNDFENLETIETAFSSETIPAPHFLSTITWDNKMDGEVYGLEVAANWSITETWKLAGGYSWLQIQLHPDDSTMSLAAETMEHASPHSQAHIRSYMDLPWNLELDTALYYVESLHSMSVPSYLRWDARLGWHITEKMELSAVVRNLLDDRHSEFSTALGHVGQIDRSFFIKFTYSF